MAGLLSRPGLDPVAAELRRWATAPFDLARDNCGLSVLAFAERMSGRVLGRGRGIAGARAAARLIADPAAFVAVSSALMRRLGAAETDAPARGDVGLVELPAGLTAAICVDAGRWAARGDRAVVIQRAEPLVAWRLACPRP